ncbi:MAG: 50S ribosomal protein L22 [Spirochaetales bacterium]|nr:MAG: 50S ribosomal protein L22 [Spirochaetales bacterium]
MEAKKGFTANAKFLMISPSKMRRVAGTIRRKPYPEAIAILEALPQKGARMLKKVVQSAAANALVQNKKLDEEMLYVKELLVNDGPRYRRVWARGRGRRDLLIKRLSHVSVILDEISGGRV